MNDSKLHDLGKALGHHKTDKRLDILRKIEEAGSISQAARMAGVSYKAAWQALDVLSNIAGTALVEKNVGGAGGGGARLTQAGKNLLHASTELTQLKDQLMQKTAVSKSQTHNSTTQLLGLRTSMRNQFPVIVRGLVKKGPFVRVMLTTKGGNVFHSSITATSAELLEIKYGHAMLALCKATAIQVTAKQSRKPKTNTLGIVIRKSRGTQMGEISLLIEPGITLTGMCDQLALMRIGDEAYAEIEESAWVLAMSDS